MGSYVVVQYLKEANTQRTIDPKEALHLSKNQESLTSTDDLKQTKEVDEYFKKSGRKISPYEILYHLNHGVE